MMDRLIETIRAKQSFVTQKVANGEIPTPQQLSSFLSSFRNELLPMIKHYPSEVTRQIKRGFTSVGWDVKKNCNNRSTPPKPQDIIDMLNNLATNVEGYLTKLHASVAPTEDELDDLGSACGRLWSLDIDRLIPNVDYVIDPQGYKKSSWETGDRAERPFFKFVDPDVLARESWRTFIALLDNYDFTSGVAERVTAQEVKEEDDFLNVNLATPCMKYVHKYLVSKKLAPSGAAEFKKFVHDLWFGLYRRKVNNDSSGFEHVFVGEEKENADGTSQVVGLHNWIQIFIEEGGGIASKRQGSSHLDYLGYIRPRCRVSGGEECQRVMSVQMEWHNELKPESSVFLGTSPAFELALYTLCFLAGEEKNLVQLDQYMVEITCYKFRGPRGVMRIGSCFPALTDLLTPSEVFTPTDRPTCSSHLYIEKI